ncbi:hypothetical protein GCK72_009955 [Caenorhabditis remanei]|uniref:Uncharacterized protein n=1 Tax=Caenorhabditis remanei TaxID=31234 RepID=A0A6A5H3X2_CAERE|nr:hypothetical protein GCK72_009955 [Caenorhabditis remanei]KAF1761699.1 hypothetical protein GCK72_009955 [Caenorhabditis remanei]
MDVVFTVRWEIVVDNKGDLKSSVISKILENRYKSYLLNVNTTSQDIGGDEDTGRSGAELAHDSVTFCLSEFVLLDKNTNWITHEAIGNVKNLRWHCSREKNDLNVLWHGAENVVNLILESTRQHLVSLVENEHLDSGGVKSVSVDHVSNTSWSSDDDMDSILKLALIIANASSSDTWKNVHIEQVRSRIITYLDQAVGVDHRRSVHIIFSIGHDRWV